MITSTHVPYLVTVWCLQCGCHGSGSTAAVPAWTTDIRQRTQRPR